MAKVVVSLKCTYNAYNNGNIKQIAHAALTTFKTVKHRVWSLVADEGNGQQQIKVTLYLVNMIAFFGVTFSNIVKETQKESTSRY